MNQREPITGGVVKRRLAVLRIGGVERTRKPAEPTMTDPPASALQPREVQFRRTPPGTRTLNPQIKSLLL